MKRTFFFTLLLVMFTAFCFTAYADNDGISTCASDLINSCSIETTRSGTTITASATVSAKDVYDQVGISTMKFQQYVDGSWTTVKTYSAIYKYETSAYAATRTYTGVSGEKYRVVCTFYVRNGVTSDTSTVTGSSFTL